MYSVMSQVNQRRLMTETRLSVYSRCRHCSIKEFSKLRLRVVNCDNWIKFFLSLRPAAILHLQH